jgi:hypothetical protein
MGRQVLFHAFPGDLEDFLEFACARDPVTVTLRDSDRPEIEPVANPAAETRVMTLWHRGLVPALQRQLVKRPPGSDYYRIAYSLQVLELSPSVVVSWNHQAALLHGRLYGFSFENAPDAYRNWYNALSRWIRAHFAKDPFARLEGYIGPAALAWFKHGGILLPMFAPPVTPEWQSFVEAQQRARDALG